MLKLLIGVTLSLTLSSLLMTVDMTRGDVLEATSMIAKPQNTLAAGCMCPMTLIYHSENYKACTADFVILVKITGKVMSGASNDKYTYSLKSILKRRNKAVEKILYATKALYTSHTCGIKLTVDNYYIIRNKLGQNNVINLDHCDSPVSNFENYSDNNLPYYFFLYNNTCNPLAP